MSFLMRFCTCVVNVLCLPLHLIYAVGLYALYKRFFPCWMYRIAKNMNQRIYSKKKELFLNLPEFKNPDGQLTILEIGCGTGANFEFYPPGSKVICTDPNPHFEKYLEKNMGENDHLKYDRFIVTCGEDMGSVEDESVDAVVITHVLCSVRNIKQTLREVHRILRPGGAYFFLEHVVADASTWTYFFQHVLLPAWCYLSHGCEVTRETWKYLEAAPFSELKLRHIEAPMMFLVKPHIIGYAVK
uniref:Methyltransferase type 11 domain-containing protein n=1 Tax=Monopterus albus TaxID=43700 RepID=A0A3Q3JQV7_MONAL|nr:methyltransferase-like protein 7A [Monopterus albus]